MGVYCAWSDMQCSFFMVTVHELVPTALLLRVCSVHRVACMYYSYGFVQSDMHYSSPLGVYIAQNDEWMKWHLLHLFWGTVTYTGQHALQFSYWCVLCMERHTLHFPVGVWNLSSDKHCPSAMGVYRACPDCLHKNPLEQQEGGRACHQLRHVVCGVVCVCLCVHVCVSFHTILVAVLLCGKVWQSSTAINGHTRRSYFK